jgi:ferredoxin-nitrite reductase
VLGCPVGGVDRDEAFDASEVVEAVNAFFTGNREYANLPRKFKMSITGCVDDCAQAEINDIGLWPARLDDGTLGFNLLVGGGLSDGPRMATDIDVFVGQDEAVEITRAIAQTFGELGNRENRGFARMRYLVQELGPEQFRAELASRAGFALRPSGTTLTRRYRGDHVGVQAQHDEGVYYVGCAVPVGRVKGTELIEIARLAETYGDGGVRLATDQNFVITGVPADRVDELCAEELLVRYSPRPGPFIRGAVACTGSEFCRFAIVETKERTVEWAEELDRRYAVAVAEHGDPGDLDASDVIRLHFSGCSASCAQPQIADIGFRGETAHVDASIVEAVDIGLGGSLGTDAGFAKWTFGAVPVDNVPELLGDLVESYIGGRRPDERFHEWIRREQADPVGAGPVGVGPDGSSS